MNPYSQHLGTSTNVCLVRPYIDNDKINRRTMKAINKAKNHYYYADPMITQEDLDIEEDNTRNEYCYKENISSREASKLVKTTELPRKRVHRRMPSANIPPQFVPNIHLTKLNQSNLSNGMEDDAYLMAEENIFENPSPKKRRPAESSPVKFEHLHQDSQYSNMNSASTSSGHKPFLIQPKFLSDQKSTSTSTLSEESMLLECNESLYHSSTGLSSSNGGVGTMGSINSLDGQAYDYVMKDSRSALKEKTDDLVFEIEKEVAEENYLGVVDTDTLNYLISREGAYAPDPYYFERYQPNVNWTMRVILVDWMMEVCMEFSLKRETFHYAVNYVDRYLSMVPSIAKIELQLIGVTSMYIASKMEEIYSPKVLDFAKSTDNGYNSDQINEMEQKILRALKWELVPPTMNVWANWYMNQWDIYIETSQYAQEHPILRAIEDREIFFKRPNEKSYARFREFMQMVDISQLDILTLQYQPRAVIASIMFLLIGTYTEQYSTEKICQEFVYGTSFIDPDSMYNDFFTDFLIQSFGFSICELLPTIQYVSSFMSLPFNYDLPSVAQHKNVLEGHFEEFLAFQTHHPSGVEFIRRKQRGS